MNRCESYNTSYPTVSQLERQQPHGLSAMVRSVQDAFHNLYLHIFHRSECIDLRNHLKILHNDSTIRLRYEDSINLNKWIINYCKIKRNEDIVLESDDPKNDSHKYKIEEILTKMFNTFNLREKA